MPSEEWKNYHKGLIADLKAWLREKHEIGDVWSVTFDPCEGCANFKADCEGYDHAWICCQGKDFKPKAVD